MDFTALVFVGLMFLIGFVLFSAPPVLTFMLYRYLSKKGKVQRNFGLAIFILTTLGIIFLGIKIVFGPSGFSPEYETVEINQKIGGKLICNSVYTADLQSWQYDINYKYISFKGDSVDFKSGTYYGRDWKKDEQILKYDKFLILKTGAGYGSDRLIIKNIRTDSTLIFDIDDKFIEKDSLWKAQKIKSLLDYCCAETFIENICNDEISLRY